MARLARQEADEDVTAFPEPAFAQDVITGFSAAETEETHENVECRK